MGQRWSQPIIGLTLLLLTFGGAAAGPRGARTPAVTAEILGVGIGTPLKQARARLDRLGAASSRTTRSGGQKAAWSLTGTDFHTVALKTDRRGRVVWISGFLRADRHPAFETLGDPDRAERFTDVQAIWNVAPRRGEAYRLVAKGSDGHAGVVYLLGD